MKHHFTVGRSPNFPLLSCVVTTAVCRVNEIGKINVLCTRPTSVIFTSSSLSTIFSVYSVCTSWQIQTALEMRNDTYTFSYVHLFPGAASHCAWFPSSRLALGRSLLDLHSVKIQESSTVSHMIQQVFFRYMQKKRNILLRQLTYVGIVSYSAISIPASVRLSRV